MRVLIVDDEARVRRAWSRILVQEAHEVAACATCEQALARLRAGPDWDAVLLDFMLEDGTAEDIARELPPAARRSVAVVSAYLDSERMLALQREGLVVLSKPVERQTLLALVEQLSHRREGASPIDVQVRSFAAGHRLSPTESEVLRLGAHGCSNRDSAELMGSSVGTIRVHWTRIRAKVGAEGKQAVLHRCLGRRSSRTTSD